MRDEEGLNSGNIKEQISVVKLIEIISLVKLIGCDT